MINLIHRIKDIHLKKDTTISQIEKFIFLVKKLTKTLTVAYLK